MKRTTQMAVFGAVTAISMGAFTYSVSAAQDDDAATIKSKAERAESLHSGKRLGQVERANKLIGREVIGSDNEKLGKIDNLIVDLESGHILYAVIGSGGVASIGEKKFAVAPGIFTEMPPTTESKKPFERSTDLHANIDKAKLSSAPQFTREIEKEGEFSRADFVNQVYQHCGQTAWWQGAASAGEFRCVHKTSDLIGMKIKNATDQPMGKVDNVAVDLPAGRVVYVILSPDSSLNLGSELYALPPGALTLSTDKKTLTSDISQEKLAGAPHFAKDNWPTLSNSAWGSQVYQYYGKQAYFESGGKLQPTGPSDQRTYPAPKKEKE
jgi:sporulation protein YlmC with PRC-barrel domain